MGIWASAFRGGTTPLGQRMPLQDEEQKVQLLPAWSFCCKPFIRVIRRVILV